MVRDSFRRLFSRKGADQRSPQTNSTPSTAPISASGPRPHTSAGAKTELQPSPTIAADPQPVPCIAQLPRQAAPDTASPSTLPGRLWTQAYEAVKEDKPRLVEAYEALLHRVLGGESDTADPKQMDQLVLDGLEKTKREAAAKQKIEDGMRVIYSVSGLVGTAFRHAPEAAAAWGGVCLLLQVLENPITEASANRDGMAYVISRMNWYWELSALLARNQERAAGLRDELEKHIIDLYKKLLSYQMKSVCLYYQSRVAVALRDAVKFDNWADAVQSLKDAENIVQRDIDTHATQEISMSLDKMAKEAKDRRIQLQDIHQAIRENTKKHEEWRQEEKDEKQEAVNEKCLAGLCATDTRKDKERIQKTKGGLFKDSYKWILENQSFISWREDYQSRLLWVKADPGKGKTMLLCGVIDELEKSTAGSLLSYFFCQATDSQINNATAVLRGLIYLLAKQQASLISHVRKECGPDGKLLSREANAWVTLSKIMENMLHDRNLKDTYLVIDALDECKTDLPQLLEFIAHNSSASPRVKWIVSSRNNPEIERQLKLDDSGVELSLELAENAEHVSHAVSAYIDFQLSKVPSLWDDIRKRGQVQDIMLQKANSTFLWVALVIQELKHPDVESWHVLQIIEEMPPSLVDLYSRMMDQMPKRDLESCLLVLSAATLAYRPLQLAEMAVLSGLPQDISIELRRVEKIVAKCGSFLTVRDGYIYLVHQSAKEYLEKNFKSRLESAGPAQRHADIGRRSIKAMSSILKQNLYNLDLDFMPKDMAPPHPDPLAPVRYSCVFWVDHLSSESPEYVRELTDEGPVFEFLKKHFLHWLESLSLLGKLSDGVVSIRKLLHVAQLQPDISPRLTTLLKDVEKFVFSHRQIIERAPLQTYGSALVFSPTMSEVRNRHWEEGLPSIKRVSGIREHWGAHRQTLEGHSDWVSAVAFSSDRKTLASASYDKTVRLWDTTTGAYRQTLEGHSDWVRAIAFSPDSKTLASASSDRTVQLWDAATGTLRQTLEGHSYSVLAIAFSPDSKTLASASADRTVRLWDTTTGALRQTLEGHSASVLAIAFSPDRKTLASASIDMTVRLWDAATGTYRQTLEGHSNEVSAIAFSPNSKTLASASKDKTVRLWDAVTGAYQHTLEGHSRLVQAIAFSPDSKTLASASNDKTVRLWDTVTGAYQHTLEGHSHSVRAVAFFSDKKTLASASDDKTVRLWDTATGMHQQTLNGHTNWVQAIDFSPDSKTLASASADMTVRLWDIATGADQQTLEGHSHEVLAIAFSPDTKTLASASKDTTVRLWDAVTGAYQQTLKGHSYSVLAIAFSPDSKTLASASNDRTVRLWDAVTGAYQQVLKGHSASVLAIAFSPDSKTLASASDDRTVQLWDTASGTYQQTLRGHSDSVQAVAFSPDKKMLASASDDSTIRLWDTATGAHRQTLEGHSDWVSAVAFSPDGKTLASASNDGIIRLWDAVTGAFRQTLEGHSHSVSALAFSPDGKHLETDLGLISISPNPDTIKMHQSSGLMFVSGEWVAEDGKDILWLPPNHRATCAAVCDKTLVLGHATGQVTFIYF